MIAVNVELYSIYDNVKVAHASLVSAVWALICLLDAITTALIRQSCI
jgi:hypothetical protein